MTQIFFIPVKFPSLNEYISAMNRNRHVGNKMKQDYTSYAAWAAAPVKKIESPVKITFTYHEANKKRDPDNITFAKKFILDGLVLAGKLPNDTQAWVLGFTETWLIDSDNVGVEVRIEELDD